MQPNTVGPGTCRSGRHTRGSMLHSLPQRGAVWSSSCHAVPGTLRARRRLPTTLTAATPAAPHSTPAVHSHGGIPGSTSCSVCVDIFANGVRGLRATRPVEEGGLLLTMPITHVLAVPNWLSPQAVQPWHLNYVKRFEQEWQVQLPKGLLDILSDVEEDTTVRLALLLLWVRGHVAAPFWQEWTQQLPQHYTASGVAWSPGAINQIQWPLLQYVMTRCGDIKAQRTQQVVELLNSPSLKDLQLAQGGSPTEAATWALQASYTRNQGGPADWNCMVLVPYSDMANHSFAAVAEDASSDDFFGLAATEDIQEGQEVTLRYQPYASNEELLAFWGFVERGNAFDWPYPIQRPLQALPRLPWEVVLAAAARLHDLVQLGPQGLLQQRGLSLSAGDLAALTDGQPVNRILAAASSLPLAWDPALVRHDRTAQLDGQQVTRSSLQSSMSLSRRVSGDPPQELWSRGARNHIMEAVRDSLDSRARQPAAAAATSPVVNLDSPQQRWEATLAALTARLLGLHARLGLLTVPTTLEEDLALEAAALTGGFVSLTPEQVAGLLAGQQEGDQEQQQALEALHARLLERTMEVAALQAAPCDGSSSSSSSSHAAVEQLQVGLADLGSQLGTLTEHRAQAPWHRQRVDQLQQLVQETPSKTGAAAAAAAADSAAGMNACMMLAIQARLQQKMLIHVYGVLCDIIAADLR